VTLPNSGASSDILTVQRQGGYFQFAAIANGVTEVGPQVVCQ